MRLQFHFHLNCLLTFKMFSFCDTIDVYHSWSWWMYRFSAWVHVLCLNNILVILLASDKLFVRVDVVLRQVSAQRLTSSASHSKASQTDMQTYKQTFLSFLVATCQLWGHWYPCFGHLVMSCLGFKARVGSLICTWWRLTWYMFPEIHLWCGTFAGVYGQHSSQSLSPYACFSRDRMPDSDITIFSIIDTKTLWLNR